MRQLAMLALTLGVAACAGAPLPVAVPAGNLSEAQKQAAETACAAAVAEHIGSGTDAVQAVWSGATPDGRGLVTVGDQAQGAQRIHFCELDDAGRVAAIRHQP